jgi:hypothetical protein
MTKAPLIVVLSALAAFSARSAAAANAAIQSNGRVGVISLTGLFKTYPQFTKALTEAAWLAPQSREAGSSPYSMMAGAANYYKHPSVLTEALARRALHPSRVKTPQEALRSEAARYAVGLMLQPSAIQELKRNLIPHTRGAVRAQRIQAFEQLEAASKLLAHYSSYDLQYEVRDPSYLGTAEISWQLRQTQELFDRVGVKPRSR